MKLFGLKFDWSDFCESGSNSNSKSSGKKKSSTDVKSVLLKSFARAIDVLGTSIFCSIKSIGVSVVTSWLFIWCAVTTACSYLVLPILACVKACVLCFLNFMRKFKNSLLGRSPLGPPDTPNFSKFGEVVEVIILLYYLGCRVQKNSKNPKLRRAELVLWTSPHGDAFGGFAVKI